MKKIKLLNKIATVGTDIFDRSIYSVSDCEENPDAIMVRSASLHDMAFESNLKAIARCGAGVNNIPCDRASENGIVVFNTPGANANGVKELAIAALILASRNIVDANKWVEGLNNEENIAKAVEAGKGAFVGCELYGKTLGVIGLGAIGGGVANAAVSLGMEVVGFDPYITVNAAWKLSRAIKKAASCDEIFRTCDYISLHIPMTPDTREMINKDSIKTMKKGVRIINLARAELVSTDDIKEALLQGNVASYVTDFPTNGTVGAKGIVNIPHLGASTGESEDNCAVMAAKELCEFLESGNITNSVNFPNVTIPHTGAARICVAHKNIPAMLTKITGIVSDEKINIENMSSGSKGEYAYTILELGATPPERALARISEIEGIIKTRVI